MLWLLLYILAGVVFFLVMSFVERRPGVAPWAGWQTLEWVVGVAVSLAWPLSLAGLIWSKWGDKNFPRLAIAAALLGAQLLAIAASSGVAHAASRAVAVAAAQASCAQVFYGGKEPTVAGNPGPTQDLCFPAYALKESGAWRQPIWSAEHLVAANLPPAGTVRKNPFHAEDALSPAVRSELSDYQACSQIDDRGHATPVGDFKDPWQRDDTFSLANMMAQTKVDNEQPWNHLENGVRSAVKSSGEAWTVTGPHVPAGASPRCGRLPQPDAIWKAVFFPSTGVIGAYWSANDTSKTSTTITVAELIRRTGVDPFPALPAAKKAEAHPLPAPMAGGD